MFALRDYQVAVADAVTDAFGRGVAGAVFQAGTGSGKTAILAEVIRRRLKYGRCLVLAHREELVTQLRKTIRSHCGVPVGTEMAGHYGGYEPVIVASSSTVGRAKNGRLERLLKYRPEQFATLVIDEAHHATASNTTYTNTLEYFGYLRDKRKTHQKFLLGCTATLRRSDGQSLSGIFDEVVADVPFDWLVKRGYLVPVKGERVDTDVSLDEVRIVAGDFDRHDLGRTVNVTHRNNLAVGHWMTYHRQRQFIAFVPTVEHAHNLAGMFRYQGFRVEAVDQSTKKDRRKEVLDFYRSGQLHGLVNVGVYLEGTDLPSASCILMLRPTRSSLVYSQAVGRGTRLWTPNNWYGEDIGLSPEKSDCVVVDFVDTCTQHALVQAPSLLGDVWYEAKKHNGKKKEKKFKPESVKCSIAVADFEEFDPTEVQSIADWRKLDDGGWGILIDGLFVTVRPFGDRWALSYGETSIHETELAAFKRADQIYRESIGVDEWVELPLPVRVTLSEEEKAQRMVEIMERFSSALASLPSSL